MSISVVMFGGGRGAASIARRLLREPDLVLSLVVNGYDNGHSTGALRRYLPGMLGPSDFRKNLSTHLDPSEAEILERRLPKGATGSDVRELIRNHPAGLVRDVLIFLEHLDDHPGLDLADCALGNLMLAGAYLRCGRNFNAAIRSCIEAFGSPLDILNVTNGENAFLIAMTDTGRVLTDEAQIVAPQDGATITDLCLIDRPSRGDAARVSLNPEVAAALGRADLIVYAPGTPHSSLLPSYMTPGLAAAITANRTASKVFVVNTRYDHDVHGVDAAGLVARTLAYLDDPHNARRTITHVLAHRPARPDPHTPALPRSGVRHGAEWIIADLEDPQRPGTHHGARTVAELGRIMRARNLVRAG